MSSAEKAAEWLELSYTADLKQPQWKTLRHQNKYLSLIFAREKWKHISTQKSVKNVYSSIFILTPKWKQLKCLSPSLAQWINNVWDIHTTEYFSNYKNALAIHATTRLDFNMVETKSKRNQSSYDSISTTFWKNKNYRKKEQIRNCQDLETGGDFVVVIVGITNFIFP